MACKYLSIDIETSGTNSATDQILEIAAVVETGDWSVPVAELPHFRTAVLHDPIVGDAEAILMNARLIHEMCADPPPPNIRNALLQFRVFVEAHFPVGERVTIAGKNYNSFDAKFLTRHEAFPAAFFRHRVIDAGNLWFDPATDDKIPDTATCLARAGLPVEVNHDALADARAVVELVRRSPWFARTHMQAFAGAA